ncbi:MAG: VOC family protein [Planctomycetaceae bacterium]
MTIDAKLIGVELYFEDLPRARAFYRDVLGLTMLDEDVTRFARFDGGPAFVCLERKGSEDYPSAEKGVLFFEVPDLARAVAALGKRIVKHEPEGRRPWAVFHDPEGHNVLLVQATKESGDAR